jgi:hypothetical protein
MKFVGALLVVAAAAGVAQAADGVRAGKWEFSMQMQLPNMAKLPPGAHLPPGISMGPNGMNVTRTTCLTEDKPIPDDIQSSQQKGDCKVEKMDRSGPAIRWQTSCTMHDPLRGQCPL